MADQKLVLDAKGVYYRQLNERIRDAVNGGVREIELNNVNGQRYIFTGLKGELSLKINGVPGQDMAAFMNGPSIRVEGNAQDGVANTMDDGKVVVNGIAGDVLGYGMRGGRLYIRGDVGYRVGIHMKAYKEKSPVIVIGGKAGDFLGEYMAGGSIILLGLFSDKPYAPICGRSLGTGMHGGVIYVRGPVPDTQLGPHLTSEPVDETDKARIREMVTDFALELGLDVQHILAESFFKVKPFSHRPYGNMYVPC
ncbi:glutamate synthase (NADPH) GltB3 subunit [Desulfocurvibacter africanus PCS]|uniref:Glutamate synthase (NADPH) GltB3 subunit n=1 Tax=Desulfocurvibacter africanus PCS TaxID=1262666 RepID=M5Q2V2_DESAF|nr:glutamate synthase [Desulfocurvibacter africanus]EMG38796.1 glutamate synthase (NADPH) GltB3 subunit [Desulfocurvibacter africanus PCS]